KVRIDRELDAHVPDPKLAARRENDLALQLAAHAENVPASEIDHGVRAVLAPLDSRVVRGEIRIVDPYGVVGGAADRRGQLGDAITLGRALSATSYPDDDHLAP